MLSVPSMLHASIVHFPIVLALLGMPLIVISARRERRLLRWIGLTWYVVLVVFVLCATYTGDQARTAVPPTVPMAISDKIDRHEQLGETIWIAAALTAACLGTSLFYSRKRESQISYRATAGAAVVLSFVTGGMAGLNAHFGGELVYLHGIGTPLMAQFSTDPGSPAQSHQAAYSIGIRPIDMQLAQAVSFQRDVLPILKTRCFECHQGFDARGNYDMSSVEYMLLEGDKGGPGIIPGDPDSSSIVRYIRGEFTPRMPKEAEPLTEDELHTIRLWIAAGAKDDTAT